MEQKRPFKTYEERERERLSKKFHINITDSIKSSGGVVNFIFKDNYEKEN